MKCFELHTGDRVPALGLGTWKAEPGEVGAAIREAIHVGYRHFDCAAIYGNEAEIGAALSEAMDDGDVRREELWITSKLWNSNHLRADVHPGLEKTLADLRLDYLDLYLVHWPVAFLPGVGIPSSPDEYLSLDDAPLGETWAGMESAVDAGLCRNIGVSNFSVNKCREVLETARIRPVVNQVELHPLLAQNELKDWSTRNGMLLTAYSPLGSLDRAEAFKKEGEPRPLDLPGVRAIAAKREATPAQVLIAWAIQRGTSVIPKSVNPGRMRENFAAAEIVLDAGDMADLAEIDRGVRIVQGDFFCPPGSPYTVEWLWA